MILYPSAAAFLLGVRQSSITIQHGFASLKTVSLREPDESSVVISAEVYVPSGPDSDKSTFLLLPFSGTKMGD